MKLFSLFLVYSLFIGANGIDKVKFYEVFESESLSKIELEIAKLDLLKSSEIKNAYLGALKMKQAQFLKTPKEKLSVFKGGRELLENSIENSLGNCEYRFLRLVIQENAPKILKYNGNITEDAKIIESKFKDLDSLVKEVVKKYAQKSKHLSSNKLK